MLALAVIVFPLGILEKCVELGRGSIKFVKFEMAASRVSWTQIWSIDSRKGMWKESGSHHLRYLTGAKLRAFVIVGSMTEACLTIFSWRNFLSICRDVDQVTVEDLNRWSVEQIDSEEHIRRYWPLYRCLYAASKLGSQTFVLNGGRRFRCRPGLCWRVG